MYLIVHHVLLALACASVGGAALRIASRTGAQGLERVLAATAVAGTVIVLETLALGLAGLGGNTWALVGAALATWAGVAIVVAPAGPRLRDELARWWMGLGAAPRLALGAAGGVFAYVAFWSVRRPSIGLDPSIYHYTEVIGWVRNGHPGSILALSYDLPFGNYPVTNEVLLTWGAAISHSFAPMSLWALVSFAVVGLGAWVALRALRVPTVARALAVAGFLFSPWVVREINEPMTDVPALAWMMTAAALAFSARERAALLAPALLAGGLAAGTKTTPILPVAVALAIGLWACRDRMRALGRPLLLAGVLALLVSAPWYVRNLFQHGSPLWPFVTLPGGDPVPPMLQLVHTSFLQRLGPTLDAAGDHVLHTMAGGAVMLGSVLVAPLLGRAGRQRAVLAAAGLAVVTAAMWMAAPTTGVSPKPGIFLPWSWPWSTLRYLLPGMAIATLGVALLARPRTWARPLSILALAGAAAWSLVESLKLGEPWLPPVAGIVAAAVAGGAVLWGLGRLALVVRAPRVPVTLGAVVGAVLVGLALTAVGRHYLERHAQVTSTTALGVKPNMVAWFLAQPDFTAGRAPVFFASRVVLANLAGDRLQHPLSLLPAHEPCPQALARMRQGWVVSSDPGFGHGALGVRDFPVASCFHGLTPRYFDGKFAVFRVYPVALRASK